MACDRGSWFQIGLRGRKHGGKWSPAGHELASRFVSFDSAGAAANTMKKLEARN